MSSGKDLPQPANDDEQCDGGTKASSPPWPHAPPHFLAAPGTFMVTAGTYLKAHVFRSRKRLRFLTTLLLEEASACGWKLEAWAVFSNHYHWIGKSPEAAPDAHSLQSFVGSVHRRSALFVNQLDDAPGRKVWHNFHETALTFNKSYFARLNYVIENPVRHGLVRDAVEYAWCSAAWFKRNASGAFQRSIRSFKTDRLEIEDDF